MKTIEEVRLMAETNSATAREVLESSGVESIWRQAGCRVNLVGSLRMNLLALHRDIDLHVYSRNITAQKSFAVMARIAEKPEVTEIRCINGLHTSEYCVAWHVTYRHTDGQLWQIDIIHIEEGSEYDGYFEHMADRITQVMTSQQRDTILRLKFDTPPEADYHGVEYYEAVIAHGVTNIRQLADWIADHRLHPPYYWIP